MSFLNEPNAFGAFGLNLEALASRATAHLFNNEPVEVEITANSIFNLDSCVMFLTERPSRQK
jgi:hypothetical protein